VTSSPRRRIVASVVAWAFATALLVGAGVAPTTATDAPTGAVYRSHKLTSHDASRTITVKVTGHKSGYTALARLSAKTSRVTW
jgi:hypothetical protein